MKNKKIFLVLGPVLFLLQLIGYGGLALNVRLAFGTVLWMGVWWVTMPVSPAITAFLPVAVNALFNITNMSSITNSYSAELIFLLAGSNIITMAWEKTGVDQRIAAYGLKLVGTSIKQQIVVWFLLSTLLSSILPNTIVAAILCSIAMSMLKFVGEGDVKKSGVAQLVLMTIAWGANNGGMLTPLGGSMNLITVNYIEQLTETEFLYADWVIQLLPLGVLTTLLTLGFLMLIKCGRKSLEGSKEFFTDLIKGFPKLSTAGMISLIVFLVCTALAFSRELYAGLLPGMRPGYIFLMGGLVMFFLKDEKGEQLITWEYAESHMMWGLFFLFAGGTALGNIVNGSGAATVFAEIISELNINSTFALVLIIVTMNVVLSDVINNTACAAVTIPIIIGIAQGLGRPVIPLLWVATASYNISYTLPTSIRAIPIGYGLNPKYMFKHGALLSVIVILSVSILGWLLIEYWPAFGVLSNVGVV